MIMRKKYIQIFTASLVILFCAFSFNIPRIADQNWFQTFQADSDVLIWGRVAASKIEGASSHGGMLGHYHQDSANMMRQIPQQADIYKGNTAPKGWATYEPQIGLQGIILSLLDRITPENQDTFWPLQHYVALFNAAVISLLLVWIASEFGIIATLIALIGLILSPWLIVFGKSSYWVIGTFFLPFLATAYHLKRHHPKNPRLIIFTASLFVAFFAKFACGYEFITTIVLAAWSCVIYYAYRDRWHLRHFIKITLLLGFTSIAAFVATFIINMLQNMLLHEGDWRSGINSIIWHAAVRMGVDTPGIPVNPDFLIGRDASRWFVIEQYLRGYINGPRISETLALWPPTFLSAIAILAIITAFKAFNLIKSKSDRDRIMTAAILASWAGLIAPLSWFILAKQHAFIHTHVNYILFYVPFLTLLLALIGRCVANQAITGSKIYSLVGRRYIGPCMIAVMLIAVVAGLHIWQQNKLIKTMSAGNLIISKRDFRIYLEKDKLKILAIHCSRIKRHHGFNVAFSPAATSDTSGYALIDGTLQQPIYWHYQPIASLMHSACQQEITMPSFKIQSIAVSESDPLQREVLWNDKIDLAAAIRKVDQLNLPNFTDMNWLGGIHRYAPLFFVPNDLEAQAALTPGRKIIFAKSGERSIVSVDSNGQWLNVTVDKTLAPEDGYPHSFKFK